MKLYILRPRENLDPNPWDPWYDKCFGMIVSAKSSKQARRIAAQSNETGDEVKEGFGNVWADPKYTTCRELVPTTPNVIVVDFRGA